MLAWAPHHGYAPRRLQNGLEYGKDCHIFWKRADVPSEAVCWGVMLYKIKKIQSDVNFHFRSNCQHLRKELCFVLVLSSPSLALQELRQFSSEHCKYVLYILQVDVNAGTSILMISVWRVCQVVHCPTGVIVKWVHVTWWVILVCPFVLPSLLNLFLLANCSGIWMIYEWHMNLLILMVEENSSLYQFNVLRESW